MTIMAAAFQTHKFIFHPQLKSLKHLLVCIDLLHFCTRFDLTALLLGSPVSLQAVNMQWHLNPSIELGYWAWTSG